MKDKEIFNWLFIVIKVCGVIALISMFLPFMGLEDYESSVFDLFFNTDELFSGAVMWIAILMIFVLEAISAIILLDRKYTLWFGVGGAITLIAIRLITNNQLQEFHSLINYGYGWWIMLISFFCVIAFSIAGIFTSRSSTTREA